MCSQLLIQLGFERRAAEQSPQTMQEIAKHACTPKQFPISVQSRPRAFAKSSRGARADAARDKANPGGCVAHRSKLAACARRRPTRVVVRGPEFSGSAGRVSLAADRSVHSPSFARHPSPFASTERVYIVSCRSARVKSNRRLGVTLSRWMLPHIWIESAIAG